jgi:hypothetical protein
MALPPSHDEIEAMARFALAAKEQEPVAYMTYKGYLLHAGDPKLAEYSEPMPLYADPRPEPTSAKPVAWLLSGGGTKNVVCFDSGNAYADPLREVMPLYAHPAPVPAVPGEVPEWLKDKLVTICDMVEDNDEYCQDIWNACRAAMLNGGKS